MDKVYFCNRIFVIHDTLEIESPKVYQWRMKPFISHEVTSKQY